MRAKRSRAEGEHHKRRRGGRHRGVWKKTLFMTAALATILLTPYPFRNDSAALLSAAASPQNWFHGASVEADEDAALLRIQGLLERSNRDLPRETIHRVGATILQESRRHEYDPELILAMIKVESDFRNGARSNRGALGLMQIQPMTGFELAATSRVTWIGSVMLHDPNRNIKFGVDYLSRLHRQFGDLRLALAAYNYGPSRIARMIESCDAIPLGYSRRVMDEYRRLVSQPEEPKTSWPLLASS